MIAAAVAMAGWGSISQPASKAVGRIAYTVSGGFTGWERTLTIEADGRAHVQVVRGPAPAAGDRQIEATTLKRLHELVSDPAFGELGPAYLPSPGGADLQDYVVSAEVGGKTLRTMTRDGANPPPILRDVLTILNGILSSSAG